MRLLVDSSSDILKEDLIKNNMMMASLKINLDGQEYQDGIDLDRDKFYEILTTSDLFPKTSQPSPQVFLEMFEEVKSRDEEVLCILLSSELSGTYQSAKLAKEMLDYDKIYLVDSLSVSYGIQILVLEAQRCLNEGLDIHEVINRLETLKTRIKILASVDTLEYLYRGGRLDKTSATIGSLVNIKPIITLNEGKVEVVSKTIGVTRAMNSMFNLIQDQKIDTSYPVYSIFTSGTNNLDKFENKLAVHDIMITQRIQIGPTIGSHVGPEAFGLIYITE